MSATPSKPKTNAARSKHFIREWAEKRNMIQADLARETGADKSTVSRWFSGNMPHDGHLDALVECLHLEDRESLFRHPDDDWMARFFRERSEDEKARIRTMLLAAFPPKVA
jgi:transcriptional regulator with XRE-family HTH domain